jgi:hypothetical protein
VGGELLGLQVDGEHRVLGHVVRVEDALLEVADHVPHGAAGPDELLARAGGEGDPLDLAVLVAGDEQPLRVGGHEEPARRADRLDAPEHLAVLVSSSDTSSLDQLAA